MASKMQHGYLVLADISGFTSFLAATELEHANDILGELLELLVGRLTPLLNLVEIEGDAVYVCAPESSVPHGETLLELFESTYAAFKDRVVAVKRQTSCTCNACRLIPTLDLKFITCCGNYVLQTVAGVSKPIGSDVNLVHRLSKNHVTELTGWRAYTLFPEMTLKHMGIEATGMHEQCETYEHLGEIKTYALDLLSRYQQMVQARRVIITPAQADYSQSLDVPAAPSVVWDWLNDPQKRLMWGGHEIIPEKNSARRGVGASNHCVHGKDRVRLQTILDWRPFDYFTIEDRAVGADKTELVMTHQLAAIPGGTRLTVTLKLEKAMPGLVKRSLCSMIVKLNHIDQAYQKLLELVQKEGATMTVPNDALTAKEIAG